MNKKEFDKRMNEVHQIEVDKGMITDIDQSYAFKVAMEAAYKYLVKESDSLPCVSESLLADMDLELRQSKEELPEIAKGTGKCYYEIGWKKSQGHFQMLLNNSALNTPEKPPT